MAVFRFKQFSVSNERAAMKLGTDSVLLGALASMPITPLRALDVGTGTGVVALMLAQRLDDFFKQDSESKGYSDEKQAYVVDAIDIDEPSVQEASLNFKNSPWADSLRAYHYDLKEWEADKPYDLIVSNPPFFDSSLLNPQERKSLARHTLSLSYRDLCAYAQQNLAPEGVLSMILPCEVEKDLIRTAVSFSLYPQSIIRIRTTQKKPPKRIVANFSRSKVECEYKELIMQEAGEYTEQYKSLMKDFLIKYHSSGCE